LEDGEYWVRRRKKELADALGEVAKRQVILAQAEKDFEQIRYEYAEALDG
jgi:hypothetical protein